MCKTANVGKKDKRAEKVSPVLWISWGPTMVLILDGNLEKVASMKENRFFYEKINLICECVRPNLKP